MLAGSGHDVDVFDQDEGRERPGRPWLRQRRLMSLSFFISAAFGTVAALLGTTTVGIVAASISFAALVVAYLVIRPPR